MSLASSADMVFREDSLRFGKWSEAAFFAALNVIRDPAPDDADPDLREMLVIAFVSVLCGATGFVDIAEFGREQLRFFNRHLKLKLGVSSRDTFSTTFRMLDPNGSTELSARSQRGSRKH